MNQLQSAPLAWGALAALLLIAAAATWWLRRPRHQTTPRAPDAPRWGGDIRLPMLSRAKPPVEPEVEIAPSRLARISGKTPLIEPLVDDRFGDAPPESATPPPPLPLPPATGAALESRLETMAAEVAARADAIAVAGDGGIEPDADRGDRDAAISVRFVPQIPMRDAIQIRSRCGGRPRLPAAMPWPSIDGVAGDFLAQLSCADLPADLWDGLGPRAGSLAFFAHPATGSAIALHIAEEAPPREAPHGVGDALFAPHGDIGFGDLATLAVRAFPEWPVDIVAVRPGDADPRDEHAPADATDLNDYDIADPAFHPFDWDSLRVMAAVLDRRLVRLRAEATVPDDASDELALALADAAATNRRAADDAAEIVTIVRESAGQHDFTAADATAVMAALHAIRWRHIRTRSDPEGGEDSVETIDLPLTRHHPGAPLWVHEYRALLFDHAKHAWCADPARLSGPMRATFEPLWQSLAAREMAAMGNAPFRYVPGFDAEHEIILLELPSSGLMSRRVGEGDHLVLTMRKIDLAAGDFSKVRTHRAP